MIYKVMRPRRDGDVQHQDYWTGTSMLSPVLNSRVFPAV